MLKQTLTLLQKVLRGGVVLVDAGAIGAVCASARRAALVLATLIVGLDVALVGFQWRCEANFAASECGREVRFGIWTSALVIGLVVR